MIEGLIQSAVLKAKARTGVSPDLVIWLVLAGVLSTFALVFFSIAGYMWLETLYGGAIAGLIVGGVHAIVALSAALRCVALRRRNTALALAKLEAEEKRSPWWSDPAVLAIIYEVAKIIGWRKLTPIVAAGALAAAFGLKRDGEHTAPRRRNGASAHL